MSAPDVPPAAHVTVTAELGAGDVARLTALVDEATKADGVGPLSEHVVLHLRHGGDTEARHLVLRLGAAGAAGSDGAIAGYAHLDPTDAVEGASAELVVHPTHRGRGHGRALVTATVAAADEPSAGRPAGAQRLRLWAHGDLPAAKALAAAMGFEEVRRLLQLRRPLDTPLAAVDLPPGVLLRTFRPGADDAEWLALNALAFRDHPEQGKWTQADLDARKGEGWFDPEGFLIAERDGRMAGYHWTKVHGGDPAAHGHDPIGEVYVVGVDPRAQGGGLGRALTLAGLHRLRSQGLGQAMLYVEADNAPALAVYRRLGFGSWHVDVMYRSAPGAGTAPIG